MELARENSISVCPTAEIASYVDGELNSAREAELELHFAGCPRCSEELNLQKHFLCALASSFEDENTIDLPHDFTKRIVTNAESSVTGLRKSNERLNAVLICTGLMLLALIALVAGMMGPTTESLEKVVVVASLIGHVVYSFLVGVGVVLRSLSGQLQMPSAIALLLIGSAVYLLYRFSRVVLRFHRP